MPTQKAEIVDEYNEVKVLANWPRRRFLKGVSALGFVGFPNFILASDTRWEYLGVAELGFKLSFVVRNEIRGEAERILNGLDDSLRTPSSIYSVYENGGKALHSRYTRNALLTRIANTRHSLGKVKSRKYFGVDGGFSSFPNLPVGKYAIAIFETKFSASDILYTEQVTLESLSSEMKEWKFVEYYCAEKKNFT